VTRKCSGEGTPFEIAQEAIVRLAIAVREANTAIKPGDIFVIGCHNGEHLANCALLAARSLMTSAGIRTVVEPANGRGDAIRQGWPDVCATCGKPFFMSTKVLVFETVR
jgi:hypothetical protein